LRVPVNVHVRAGTGELGLESWDWRAGTGELGLEINKEKRKNKNKGAVSRL